jgi:aldehyde dehydrogenase
MNQALVQDVVAEVMRRLGNRGGGGSSSSSSSRGGFERVRMSRPNDGIREQHRVSLPVGQYGVFSNVDEAVAAATDAQKKLLKLSLEDRDAIVKLVKQMAKDNAEAWGRMEFDETKIGRLDHKIEKLKILELVPGVEFLKTTAMTGSNGVCLEEFAPYGVIGIITPVTHSVPTLSANVINMVASGNAIVANPHPSGAQCAAYAVREYNKAIAARFGIEHLVTIIVPPTLETADAIFNHRGIPLLVVTGRPRRRAAALRRRSVRSSPAPATRRSSSTRPPASATRPSRSSKARRTTTTCCASARSRSFCVDAVFDKLMAQMEKAGGYVLDRRQIEPLTKQAFKLDPKDNKSPREQGLRRPRRVGAGRRSAGGRVPPATQLVVGETDIGHLFVQHEQMMPFVPFVRVKDVDAGDRPGDQERARLPPHGHHPLANMTPSRVRPPREHDAVRRQRRQPERPRASAGRDT